MKIITALLLLLLFVGTRAALAEEVEAITAVTLPVESVTIYQDGLMAVKRMGSLDTTAGSHDFMITLPKAADVSSALLRVSNATVEKVVYDGSPVYTLNFTTSGEQSFVLGYLMDGSGYWSPRYDIHLMDEAAVVRANAIVTNRGGEDLEGVRVRLVAGMQQPILPKAAPKLIRFAEAAALEEFAAAPEGASRDGGAGELETLYVFELYGRKDLAMDKEIGFPLFGGEAALVRIYTWDAYYQEDGPAVEEIRVNNTMSNPWPSGKAILYRDDEYVSTITMPFTPSGTNASIVVGASADLKVSKKLKGYNITERLFEASDSRGNHTLKEINETWSYQLKVESNLDRAATLEATDIRPQEAELLAVIPEPVETTATTMKWRLDLQPREKATIEYIYRVRTTESLEREG